MLSRYTIKRIAAVSILLFSTNGIGLSQDVPDRVLNKITYPDEPAEISNIKVENKNILFGKNFSASENWLKGMSLDLRNVSDKPIVYISVGILFQPIKANASAAIHELSAGFNKSIYKPTDIKGESIKLSPGEVINLTVNEREYLRIGKLISYNKLEVVPLKVSIFIHNVAFDDETKWAQGQTLIKDPNDPTRWIPGNTDNRSSRHDSRPQKYSNLDLKAFKIGLANYYEESCYAPDGLQDSLCSRSLNNCTPVYCSKNTVKVKSDPMGYYFTQNANLMCWDCEDDYCGSTNYSLLLPGCTPITPSKPIPKLNGVSSLRIGKA